MITGLGYANLYYNDNYEYLISKMIQKRHNRLKNIKKLIKKFWIKKFWIKKFWIKIL